LDAKEDAYLEAADSVLYKPVWLFTGPIPTLRWTSINRIKTSQTQYKLMLTASWNIQDRLQTILSQQNRRRKTNQAENSEKNKWCFIRNFTPICTVWKILAAKTPTSRGVPGG
jgi:hypothetical protein